LQLAEANRFQSFVNSFKQLLVTSSWHKKTKKNIKQPKLYQNRALCYGVRKNTPCNDTYPGESLWTWNCKQNQTPAS